jgi:hypothetical protein
MKHEPIKVDLDFSKERKAALHLFLWMAVLVTAVVLSIAAVH